MNHLDNIYYFIDKFDSTEILNLNKKINIIYRNYNKKSIEDDIKKIKDLCVIKKRKIFISNNLKIALKFNLNGLYIPSFNKNLNFRNIPCKKEFSIIGSAHNLEELRIKERQGCKYIFVSPVFRNPKNTSFLDIIKLNYLIENSRTDIIALGGINNKNIKRLSCTQAKGFAGISWIKKTGLHKM